MDSIDNKNLLDEQAMLKVEIKNQSPVDLIDYAQSMISLGAEYSDFITSTEDHLRPGDIKLYVKEIKTGSIITDLVALTPAMLPFIEHSNTVVDFAKHLGSLFGYLKRGEQNTERPEGMDKQTLVRVDKFLEPVARDPGSQIMIHGISHCENVHINVNSIEANAIQNQIRREIEALREPLLGLHKRVVLYWAQARNTNTSRSGDKARIESIYKGDVRVAFDDEDLKHFMLHKQPHPFDTAYVVDVYVETINEKPVLYKVVCLHDTFEIER